MNVVSNDGETPIHYAAGHIDGGACVRALLDAGADVNAAAENAMTPPHRAARLDDSGACMRALLAAGADVNAVSNDGKTPLHHGARYSNDEEIVRFLIRAGASVNARNDNGACALLMTRTATVARVLLNAGADVNVSDNAGMIPLHNATRRSNIDGKYVRSLLRHGAEVNAADNKGRTPLHHAYQPPTVRLLISAGADVNARDDDGITPLCICNEYGKTKSREIMRALISAGADISATDITGRSPLHDAVARVDVRKVRLLLDESVDVHVTDRHGDKPLHMLRTFLGICEDEEESEVTGDENEELSRLLASGIEIIEALLAAGADVNAINEQGETPLFALLSRALTARDRTNSICYLYYGHWRVTMQPLWEELVKGSAHANIVAFINDYGPLTCAHLAVKFADVDLLSTYLADGDARNARRCNWRTNQFCSIKVARKL